MTKDFAAFVDLNQVMTDISESYRSGNSKILNMSAPAVSYVLQQLYHHSSDPIRFDDLCDSMSRNQRGVRQKMSRVISWMNSNGIADIVGPKHFTNGVLSSPRGTNTIYHKIGVKMTKRFRKLCEFFNCDFVIAAKAAILFSDYYCFAKSKKGNCDARKK